MKPTVPIPERLKALPFSEKWGLPVPYFVAEVDGEYEFRIADSSAWTRCVTEDLCWVCGQKLGSYRSFAIGPMCVINRISSDPPMHRVCAEYSVQVCPFMLNPEFRRREKDRPPLESLGAMPGELIERNPGVTLLWTTRKTGYHLQRVPNGWLFNLAGKPEVVTWWALGRAATRAEVEHSIETGLPRLRQLAEEDGPKALKALEKARESALTLLPPELADKHVYDHGAVEDDV